MVGNWLKNSLIMGLGFIGLLLTSLSVSAQDSTNIVGFWKQKTDSVYIEIKETNGVIDGEMIRNDWSPGLVGMKVFQQLTPGKKNKWTGQAYIIGSDDLGTVNLSLKGGDQLETKIKPGRNKKIKWVRSEAIEKRY